ncbi:MULTISPECIES: iron-sulfur cluster repair di-iron protein, ric [Bacillales]|uniref:Regulator of cell morphogenesis and NO signaling n=1 Tax=Salimicrobium salexigens TaxID=908941 RepID=A0ABY1L2Q6_9BACI|nr:MULTISPECIES: iron-sulfur cluster repair di-iron protein, ric [Bacillales]AQL55595.1 iron-sulfur cluster repair di-iron protein, ric [Abyssicoccus albus]SIS96058.1 regulator of cell morphogenesis and NO signaling [Salimicrobium salexigens]
MSEQTFNEVITNHFEKLDLYTTAITRAHGKNHPEAFEVRELFEKLSKKVKDAGANKPDLDVEFAQLRKITNNYAIPGDVCETYAGTYEMLSEVDKAYQA